MDKDYGFGSLVKIFEKTKLERVVKGHGILRKEFIDGPKKRIQSI